MVEFVNINVLTFTLVRTINVSQSFFLFLALSLLSIYVLIFRTIEADVKGLNNQFGILGKSFANIRADLSNGQGIGFSLFSRNKLSANDIEGLRGLNNIISITH